MNQLPFITDQDFGKLNGKAALPKGEYDGCHFEHCDFTQTPLSNYKFSDCSFSHCDLSNTPLVNTQFNQIRFTDCKLIGLDFSTCDDFLFTVHFEGCPMDMASFYQRRMNATQFINCSLKKVDFTQTELEKAHFKGSNLEGAYFENSILMETDFREARNLHLDPEKNQIMKAYFQKEQLTGLLTKYQLRVE
jgi:uncharacterized protein YjbI with pentapeptide repeats